MLQCFINQTAHVYIALHTLFTLKPYVIRFPNMTVIHKLDLFDKTYRTNFKLFI